MDRKKQIAVIIENFNTIFHALFKVAPSLITELKITHTQMIILSLVKENKGISLKKLAGTMGITSSAATQQVNKLVKKGYLVRKESNVDRRLVNIRLSGEMDQQIELCETIYLEQLITFFTVITDEELELYYELNSRIAKQFKNK